jgi:hypothetical protein
MSRTFKRGDHVAWNSEAGRVRGTVMKKVVSAVTFKGYTHYATKEEPQYFLKSDKTIRLHDFGKFLGTLSPRLRVRLTDHVLQNVIFHHFAH